MHQPYSERQRFSDLILINFETIALSPLPHRHFGTEMCLIAFQIIVNQFYYYFGMNHIFGNKQFSDVCLNIPETITFLVGRQTYSEKQRFADVLLNGAEAVVFRAVRPSYFEKQRSSDLILDSCEIVISLVVHQSYSEQQKFSEVGLNNVETNLLVVVHQLYFEN